jgi:hypothetical protein
MNGRERSTFFGILLRRTWFIFFFGGVYTGKQDPILTEVWRIPYIHGEQRVPVMQPGLSISLGIVYLPPSGFFEGREERVSSYQIMQIRSSAGRLFMSK